MAKPISIAIDGPAGAGKSTIARRLAKELGFYYVDTGAIYRTVAYFFDLWGVSPKDIDGITRYIDELTIGIEYDDEGVQHMIMNGMDVTGDIRTPDLSQKASLVSAHAIVRDLLLDMQREMAEKHNVIMDGRDIGTVVLPKATVKIFLTATPEVRAKRRTDELIAKGQVASMISTPLRCNSSYTARLTPWERIMTVWPGQACSGVSITSTPKARNLSTTW